MIHVLFENTSDFYACWLLFSAHIQWGRKFIICVAFFFQILPNLHDLHKLLDYFWNSQVTKLAIAEHRGDISSVEAENIFNSWNWSLPGHLQTNSVSWRILERNRCNKQYSARLTRWLDRLTHFDISIQHIAESNLKFTDYLSRNPVGGATPEENYEE